LLVKLNLHSFKLAQVSFHTVEQCFEVYLFLDLFGSFVDAFRELYS